MKTILLLLFPIYLSAQTVYDADSNVIFSIDYANDTSIVGINPDKIHIDIIEEKYGNHMFFVESKDKSYVNWHTVRGVYYFKKLD
jgi:hypothetical protein